MGVFFLQRSHATVRITGQDEAKRHFLTFVVIRKQEMQTLRPFKATGYLSILLHTDKILKIAFLV